MQLRRPDVRLPQAAGNMMSWLQGIRREQSGMIERRANQDRGSQPVAAVGPMHMPGVQQAAPHRVDAQPYPPRRRRYPSHRAIPVSNAAAKV